MGRLLVAPAIALIGIVALVPLVYSIWTAFVRFNLRSQDHPFVGFDNFAAALGDPNFRRALIFTFAIAGVVTVIEVTLGTGLAIALHSRDRRWRQILLPLLVAPMFVAPVVVGQLWKLFTSSTYGVLNPILSGLPGLEVSVDWLAGWPWNLVTIAASDIWQWTPLPLVIVLAALSAFDDHVLEAAAVDGADGWRRLRHITLPLLTPAILTAIFFRFADALRMYDKIVVLTNGGPGRNTETITFYLVEKGLRGSFDTGVATAGSWIFLIITSLLLFRFLSRRVAA
jgi:multiple sugar transport system permease protein